MLETEQLYLRPLIAADAGWWYKHLKDPAVSGSIGCLQQPFTLDQAEDFCRMSEEFNKKGLGYMTAIHEQANPAQPIGYVGMAWRKQERPQNEWEVGYWLAKEHWGKGYTVEALNGMVEQVAKGIGLKALFAELAQTNHNSLHVLNKCGFGNREEFTKATPNNPARPSFRLWLNL